MFLVYNLLLTLLSPLWVPLMLLRSRRRAEPVDWNQRQGEYPLTMRKDRKRIWIHAVSVGEVVAALPILRGLKEQAPDFEVVLSVTTSSGHQTAREQAEGLFTHLVYFPVDVPRFMLAAMSRVQPAVVAIMETELWFNFLWASKTVGARTLLINGRISQRSFQRYRYIRPLMASMLRQVDRCLMQSGSDAKRITELGGQNVEVLGNVKYDQAAEPSPRTEAQWRETLGIPVGKAVIVVGSTRSELEEELVVQAIREVGLNDVCVVHAPRHLERVPELADRVRKAFGSVGLRSKGDHSPYLILDTYGELASLYSIASVVVVGGGFDELGGQNILQPLAQGKPVIHGPHMANFAEVARSAEAAGATKVAATAPELADAIRKLLDDPQKRRAMGEAALALIERNLGAADRYVEAILAEARPNAERLEALYAKKPSALPKTS